MLHGIETAVCVMIAAYGPRRPLRIGLAHALTPDSSSRGMQAQTTCCGGLRNMPPP